MGGHFLYLTEEERKSGCREKNETSCTEEKELRATKELSELLFFWLGAGSSLLCMGFFSCSMWALLPHGMWYLSSLTRD